MCVCVCVCVWQVCMSLPPLLTSAMFAHLVFSCFCSSLLFSGERSANRSAESLHNGGTLVHRELDTYFLSSIVFKMDKKRLDVDSLFPDCFLVAGQDDYYSMQIYRSCLSHLTTQRNGHSNHIFPYPTLSRPPLLTPACCTLAGKAKQRLVLRVTALI